MYKALYLSPMVPSYNVRETLKFFVDLFNFKVARDENDYVIIFKENLTLHILRAGAYIGEMEFYLEVDDIDAIWNHIGDKLSENKVKPPFERDYGMREFHVIVPHTKTLMFVGQLLQ
jgi:hypothetical protein